MTKSELKTGMIVTYRDGKQRVVFKDTTMFECNKNFITDGVNWSLLSTWEEDLTCSFFKEMDIMKVEVATSFVMMCRNPVDIPSSYRKTIWERPTPKKMTVSEIESILGYKIEIIAEKENYYE